MNIISLDMSKARHVKQVLLDGQDVTRGCYRLKYGDDGWVDVFVRDPDGRLKITTDESGNIREVVRARRFGRVEVVFDYDGPVNV